MKISTGGCRTKRGSPPNSAGCDVDHSEVRGTLFAGPTEYRRKPPRFPAGRIKVRDGTCCPATGAPELTGEALADAVVIKESLAEPERFAVIFDRHADELYRYAARRLGPELAEDVVAEVFLTAFRKRASYEVSRLDARPWLYGIATLTIRQHRRAEARRHRLLARSPIPVPAEGFEERSSARVSAERLLPELAAAWAQLSSVERDLLSLLAWADLTYEQAAQALGVPVGTVRSRLHRLRAKLRRALGGDDPTTRFEESLT